MLDVLRGDTIRGVVFSIYDEFGYQTLYSFPPPIEDLDVHLPIDKSLFEKWQKEKDQFFNKSFSVFHTPPTKRFGGLRDISLYTERDFLQIAVKSISLLIGEKVLERDPSLLNMKFYGILPYPDLHVYSYTFFRFYTITGQNLPRACTFSLLIDKIKKNFIYDNHDFLNVIIQDIVNSFVAHLETESWTSNKISKEIVGEIQALVKNFFEKLLPISGSYSHVSPLDSHRSKKIIFTGLKNSGKNSYLLTLNRKFSKLVNQETYQDDNLHMAHLLGTTVLNWEFDQKPILPEHIIDHSEIYLDDADVIYFFIDGSNTENITESQVLFTNIITHLNNKLISIPINIIVSKIDKDIQQSPSIQNNIALIKKSFTELSSSYSNPIDFYETSIFSIASCLSAFSSGISYLVNVDEVIQNTLQTFAKKLRLSAIMLFNEFGLKFSSFINLEENLNSISKIQSIELHGSKLINIFEKSKNSIIPQGASVIKANMGKSGFYILKKVFTPYSFYILVVSPIIPEDTIEENLNKLRNELILGFGK